MPIMRAHAARMRTTDWSKANSKSGRNNTGNGAMASPVQQSSLVVDVDGHRISLQTYREVNEFLESLPDLPEVQDFSLPPTSSDSDCLSRRTARAQPRRKGTEQAVRHSARLDDLHFCPHCQNWLCKSTFIKHQRKYRSGEQWLDRRQVQAMLNGKRPRSPAIVDPYSDYSNSTSEELARMVQRLEAESGFDIHNSLVDVQQQLQNADDSEASDVGDAELEDSGTSASSCTSEAESECEGFDDLNDSSSPSLASVSELEDTVMTFLEAKSDLGDGE